MFDKNVWKVPNIMLKFKHHARQTSPDLYEVVTNKKNHLRMY